jgi:multidrug efflux pump subunit AcrB
MPLYTEENPDTKESRSWIWRIHQRFEHHFEKFRDRYKEILTWALYHRALVLIVFGLFVLGSGILVLVIGEDFFPYVDAGQMRMHVRAPEGTRIEDTEQIFARIEQEIRHVVPADETDLILDNIGLPASGINLAFSDSSSVGNADGDILISLKENHHPTRGYIRKLRAMMDEKFPQESYFFPAANITNQILNFGLPAPIDVQVVGRDAVGNYKVAEEIRDRMRDIPGAVDVHIHQQIAYPEIDVDVDRSKAQQLGLSQRDVASSLLISLSGSYQTAPNQWLNYGNGVNYTVTVQTPQYKIDSMQKLENTPLTSSSNPGGNPQLLSNVATFRRSVSTAIVNHYNVQPTYDIFADADQRDLGGVARDINKIIADVNKHLGKGSFIVMRGQVQTMNQSFTRLGIGILFAIIFVYLLMAVNFQSWIDPAIILMALPGAFAGILWMLFVTQTTFNVPSLMGTIMSIGVATANSILLVTFANDERLEGKDRIAAAISAGYTRLRPVCMTALAMIIGMLPMALAMGEGGEQNAPLGRAVIGGLMLATVSTLIIVPIVYSLLRRNAPVDYDHKIDEEWHEPNVGEQPQNA